MAVRFDALDDAYGATTGLPAGTTYSAVFWAQIVTDRNADSNVLTLDGGTNGVFVGTESNGTTVSLSDYSIAIGSVAFTVGTWYRVGVTVNGTAAVLYTGAAGAALASASGTLGGTVTPTQLGIGGAVEIDPSQWWNGRVAGFKLWSATLTAAEVENELTQLAPARTANLTRWHPFINAELIDYSGNGNSLTAGATATSTEDGPPIPWEVSSAQVVLPAAGGAATTAVAENAAGTGAANNAAPKVTPAAGAIAGTGAANNAAISTIDSAQAENAAGTGAANNAAISTIDSAQAEAAAGTGAANNAAISTIDSAQAENAAGTGAANNAAAKVVPVAGAIAGTGEAYGVNGGLRAIGAATGTGASNQPAIAVKATIDPQGCYPGAFPGEYPGEYYCPTGLGQAPAATPGVGGKAANAQGVGSAVQPAATIVVTIATAATGTGAANNATAGAVVVAAAGNAAGTGAANNAAAVTAVVAAAGNAAGTGAANNATAVTAVVAVAGNAAGTGAVDQPAVDVKTNAEQAAGTGQALDASPTTATVTNAPAGNAEGTGAANAAAVALTRPAEPAAGTGSAGNAAPVVAPGPAAGEGTGEVPDATRAATFTSGQAAGTGSAADAVPSVATEVQSQAQATGAAYRPALTAVVVNAGNAAGTGAANSPSVPTQDGTLVAGAVAGGDGAALNPSILVAGRGGRGWESLIAVLRDRPSNYGPQSCPNDGEPYRRDQHGHLVCPYDGHRPAGSPVGVRGVRRTVPSAPRTENPPGWGP